MDIKKLLESRKEEIDAKISEFIPRKLDKNSIERICGKPRYAYDADTASKAVNEPIWDLLDRGGKRWRPVLFLLANEAFGGDSKKVMDFVVIPEVVHNGCVTGDTLILTPGGILKSITHLQEGDSVLSVDNEGQVVSRKVTKKHDNGIKPVYTVKTPHRTLTVTGNHPFLVAYKQQPTRMRLTEYGKQQLVVKLSESNQTISEFVDEIYPMLLADFSTKHLKNALYRYGNCLVTEHVSRIISDVMHLEGEKCWQSIKCEFEKAEICFKWMPANQIKSDDLVVISRGVPDAPGTLPVITSVKQNPRDRLKIPSTFNLEMAQLAGFLLGDGSIEHSVKSSRVTLCLPENQPGRKEYEQLVERMFSAKPSLSKNTITCCSKALAKIFVDLGLAKHACDKTIPEWVYSLPREHKLAFVKGYLDADGTVGKAGTTYFACASKELIVGLKSLLDSLGFVTSNITQHEVDNTHFGRPVKKPKTMLYALSLFSRSKTLREIGTEISMYTQRLSRSGREVTLRYEEEIPSIPKWFPEELGFDKIVSVEYAGEQQTYDATIEATHNYIANGVVTHNTLMVDDVEDNSDLRRGQPCTHKKYGVDVAINAGNAMYYLPLLSLMKNRYKFPAEVMLKAYEIYSQEMINLSYGQGMDIWWHKGNKYEVSEDEYLQMCSYKTGTLARMSAKLGALFAGANEKQLEAIGKFAESLGVGFQIQDDVLNLVGEEFAKGKGVGEDIHEGKRTLLVIHALKNSGKKGADRLREIMLMHTSEQKVIDEAISIIKKAGSFEYAQNRGDEIVATAWNELDPLLKPSEAKEALKALAEYGLKRKI